MEKEAIKHTYFELNRLIGVTGREQEVIRYCKEKAEPYADSAEVMANGNLIVTFDSGTEGPSVMISAHTDEIGYIVKYIMPEGFIQFEKIGGLNIKTMPARRVLLQGRKGIIPGIIGLTPGHVQTAQETEHVFGTKDSYIDVGAFSAREVQEMGIEVGTRIVPDSPAIEMYNKDLVTGRAADDRIGCAVLLELCRHIRQMNFTGRLHLVFSVMEEVYVIGAAQASRYLNPDYCILLDTFVAGGTPEVSRRRLNCDIGKGPVISYIDIIPGVGASLQNDRLAEAVREISAERDIPVQYITMAEDRYGGDAMAVMRNGNQCPCLTLTIPRRYSHSPSELFHMNDAWNAYRILLYLMEKKLDLNFLA